MSLDTRGIQIANGSKNPDDEQFDASLSVGDIRHYVKDEGITARVVAEKKIIFEENETSLSASALVLLQRDG